MVSHSSHTNHEFLILVIQVNNVSSGIASFVNFLNFLISKILLSFFFLIWRTYYELSYGKFCKKQVGKMSPKSSKTPVQYKTPVKLQA